MKEATGETSMTVITIVAIGVIATILAFLWPNIQGWIEQRLNDTMNEQDGYIPNQNTTLNQD